MLVFIPAFEKKKKKCLACVQRFSVLWGGEH